MIQGRLFASPVLLAGGDLLLSARKKMLAVRVLSILSFLLLVPGLVLARGSIKNLSPYVGLVLASAALFLWVLLLREVRRGIKPEEVEIIPSNPAVPLRIAGLMLQPDQAISRLSGQEPDPVEAVESRVRKRAARGVITEAFFWLPAQLLINFVFVYIVWRAA